MQTPLPPVPPIAAPPLPSGLVYRGSSIPGFNAWKNPLRKAGHKARHLLEYFTQ